MDSSTFEDISLGFNDMVHETVGQFHKNVTQRDGFLDYSVLRFENIPIKIVDQCECTISQQGDFKTKINDCVASSLVLGL